jgi:hypothetical protein
MEIYIFETSRANRTDHLFHPVTCLTDKEATDKEAG